VERTTPLVLCVHPTPVERIGVADTPPARAAELWVKRDDRTHPIYGGNKVRKLEWLLADARARGAKHLVTIGAAGSHHVLATTYFGTREGFDVQAVLVPQPRTPHAVDVLRASVALGLRPIAVRSWTAAAPAVVALLAAGLGGGNKRSKRKRFIPLGGSSVIGAMGYVSAAGELAAQVRSGEMPEPDVCVVALGSGGTAAGLAAGFQAERMKTRVVGVCVSQPPWALLVHSRLLALRCVKSTQLDRLRMDARFLGKGYGHATPEGEQASRVAEAAGLELDPTYTAKAFASALWHLRARKGRVVLYWHTLSSAPLAPLLERAPSEEELDPRLRRLLARSDEHQ
jgi:D-cysteine desulfhydrase